MAAAGGTRMASMNSQELEDDLLWSEDSGGARDGAGSESEEPETSGAAAAAAPPSSGGAAAPAGLDIAGANNSHQSSTLRASLDESSDPGMPTPSPPVDVPGGGGLAAARRGMMMHQQQQQHQRGGGGGAYARLGTSAPIAIPNMSAWRAPTDKASGGRGGDVAGTFIPPHQLSRHDDFTFSFTGASPSAAIKRERLRARNAILRSTGFLEPQAGGAAIPAGGAAAAAAAAGGDADKGLGRTSVQSSLTAALTTIGES